MVEEGIPDCLKNGRKEEKWRKIARFRVGNEMREGKKKKGDKLCRLCGWEEEG